MPIFSSYFSDATFLKKVSLKKVSLKKISLKKVSLKKVSTVIHRQHLGLLSSAILICAPLSAQAALPLSIQTALNKAALTSDNISLIITPVGDRLDSHLPPIIKVVDSTVDSDSATDSDTELSKKSETTPIPVENNDNNKNKDALKEEHSPNPVIVDRQAIERRERQLQAYTDDPYTYQSLESPPPILVIDETRTIRYSRTENDIINNENANHDAAHNRQNIDQATRQSVPLVSHNPNISRTPASTMKLIPGFIALDTLGADFVWFTRVYHTGLIIGDRLHGDLVIQGSGDPKMTHERLEQLLYRVQKSGIHHINGDIIVDSSIFKNVSKDPAAFDNAPLRPYNASPDGFLVNFNSLGIYTYPSNNGQAPLKYLPPLANYQLPTSINTRTGSCSQAGSSLAPQWQKDQLVFNTSLPDSCGEHVFYINYPDAKDFATRIIAQKWQALGNTLTGQVLNQEEPYLSDNRPSVNTQTRRKGSSTGWSSLPLSSLPIVSYPSYNLTEQIYDINHFSNNVMTEQVALSIGSYVSHSANNSTVSTTIDTPIDKPRLTSLYQFDPPKSTSYSQALEQIHQWWQENLTTTPPYLTNGSGLCRDCTVTAANLDELLTYAYRHPSFDAYLDSLGVAGISGTIVSHSERLPASAAIGRAWIKTGTLSNVSAMAGYVKGQSGQDYIVVGIINTKDALNPYIARPVLDAVLDWTAQK